MPHGRTIGLPTSAVMKNENQTSLLQTLVPYWEDKHSNVTKYTAILMSHCLPYRMDLVKQLKKNGLFVAVFGKCGNDIKRRRCYIFHLHNNFYYEFG